MLNRKIAEASTSFLKSLLEETYILDTVGRHNVRSRTELEELLNILSSAIGSLTKQEQRSGLLREGR